MTRRSKLAAALAPVACLFCPIHLVGFAGGLFGFGSWMGWAASLHGWAEWIWTASAILAAVFLVYRWERRAHRHRCCDHGGVGGAKVVQENCTVSGDMAGRDIYK